MARPTVRVLALLELLQSSPRTRPLAELADRLGVDERTVRRYVEHLAELDVPVRSVRGRYGGIALAPGYRMPPLMLSEDEAVAVVLGLLAAAPLAHAADSSHGPRRGAGESALAKLRRVLPVALAARVDALTASARVASPDPPAAAPRGGVLLDLATAARQRHPVVVDHTAADGRRTHRTVHPYGLVAHRGRWYLAAAEPTGGGLRTFRVDRITTTRLLPATFAVPADLDVTAHVLSSLAATPWQHEVLLRLPGTPEHVRSLFPPGLVTTDRAPGHPGWSRALLRAERLDWLPALLAALPTAFVIEAPPALRDLVRDLAERLTAAAAPENDPTPRSGA